MDLRSPVRVVSLVVLALAAVSPAAAAPTVFTDRSGFEAAVPGLAVESFEAPLPAAPPFVLPGFTVAPVGAELIQSPNEATDGAFSLRLRGLPPATAVFTFDQPIDAFAVEILDFGDQGEGTLTYEDDSGTGGVVTLAITPPLLGDGNRMFFGIVNTDAPFTQVRLTSTVTNSDAQFFDELQFRLRILDLCSAEELEGQGYWHRQCLGTAAARGGLTPGRTDRGRRRGRARGPQHPTEPGFVDELMPCAEAALAKLGLEGLATCDALDAEPPDDPCQRAHRQLTALVLNVCSGRIETDCPVEPAGTGCLSDTVGGRLVEAAGLIQTGSCRQAARCAASVLEDPDDEQEQ